MSKNGFERLRSVAAMGLMGLGALMGGSARAGAPSGAVSSRLNMQYSFGQTRAKWNQIGNIGSALSGAFAIQDATLQHKVNTSRSRTQIVHGHTTWVTTTYTSIPIKNSTSTISWSVNSHQHWHTAPSSWTTTSWYATTITTTKANAFDNALSFSVNGNVFTNPRRRGRSDQHHRDESPVRDHPRSERRCSVLLRPDPPPRSCHLQV